MRHMTMLQTLRLRAPSIVGFHGKSGLRYCPSNYWSSISANGYHPRLRFALRTLAHDVEKNLCRSEIRWLIINRPEMSGVWLWNKKS